MQSKHKLFYITWSAGLVMILLLSIASISLAQGDTWDKNKAGMRTARAMHCTAVVNGKIYVFGGFKRTGAGFVSTVEQYDPATDIWETKKANIPTNRYALSCGVVNGKIFVIGGTWDVYQGAHTKVEVYDPTTDTWDTTKASMPTARMSLSTSVVNGKIYAIGGKPLETLPSLATVEKYDPTTDTWTTKTDMPTARWGLSTCVVDGKIYAIGGNSGWKGGGFNMLRTVEVYDPMTDKWSSKANMQMPRDYFITSVVDGMIYAIGGSIGIPHRGISINEAYDPTTNQWTSKANMPTKRLLPQGTNVVNRKIYAIGGVKDGPPNWTGLSTVEVYTPHY